MITASHTGEHRTSTIYIKPTYAVIMPTPNKSRGPLTDLQRENMRNLERNQHDGKLSQKSIRKLVNAVNWLVASAPKKWVFQKESGKRFSFRVNFVTLTLPTTDHDISDHHFKKIMLHAFINACRYRYDLKNFVWKVEAQANGNIHAHFTTDTYLPWRGVRDVWNRILAKNGLIDKYHDKHKDLSFQQYVNMYGDRDNVTTEDLRRRYQSGVDSNWRDPNSTDVHAVHKVKDIAAYLAKYMSKEEEERRKIKGRLWSCSYGLSQANGFSAIVEEELNSRDIEQLYNNGIEYHTIDVEDKITKEKRVIGTIFFFKLEDWKTKIRGRLSNLYHEVLFYLRNGMDLNLLFNPPPEIMRQQIITPRQQELQTYCPF